MQIVNSKDWHNCRSGLFVFIGCEFKGVLSRIVVFEARNIGWNGVQFLIDNNGIVFRTACTL